MEIKSLVFAICLMTASLAHAQNLQTIKLPSAGQLQAVQVDPNAAALRKLEIANKKLSEENARLKEENDALKRRVEGFTSLGGSEVHAYCPNSTTSRNTAGEQADCSAGGYLCEPVTGLCRSSCQTSDQCATDFGCANNRCVAKSSLINQD